MYVGKRFHLSFFFKGGFILPFFKMLPCLLSLPGVLFLINSYNDAMEVKLFMCAKVVGTELKLQTLKKNISVNNLELVL